MPPAARALALTLAALAVGAAGCGGGGSTGQTSGPLDSGSRVFVIVLENREFNQVIGDPQAPYFNRLATRNALANRFFAVSHPSLPNYLAMVGGSTFGIDSDCTRCKASGPNLGTQLSDAGIDWRAYMEGMPRSCFEGGYSGRYAKKHNPFYYFPQITSDPGLCARVVPGEQLAADLRGGGLPRFGWLTPDLCNDAHDCSFAVADRYLSRLVPRLRRHLGPDGYLVITFDEGETDAGCCGAEGGRIATVLLGPAIRRNARLADPYTSYSLLATLEDSFALPRLREASDTDPMSAAFR
ncbi:MAG: alkaline phosphatase family protein [Solirubrobacterales bacterium]